MANTVKFTCVPMGIVTPASGGMSMARLQVLVTPTLDDQTKLTNFMSWGTAVRMLPAQFQLAQIPTIALTLRTDIIQPGLWSILLGDAKVDSQEPKINSGGLARPIYTPITEHGVQLSNTRDLARSFHLQGLSNLRNLEVPNFAVPMDWLKQFHKKAIKDHSLFRKHPESNLIVYADSQNPDDLDLIAAIQATDLAPEAVSADTLILNRFGVYPPYIAPGPPKDPQSDPAKRHSCVYARPVGSNGNTLISPPISALYALGHIRVQLVNSLRLANGSDQAPIPSEGPKEHLAYHVNRLISSPSHQSSSAAKKISETVKLRPAYSFNKRIAMLLNAPAILEALGLILHFEFPATAASGLTEVSLREDCVAVATLKAQYADPIICTTMCNSLFLPQYKTAGAIRDNGWMEPSDGYQIDSLQLDSAAMQITQFASQAALREAAPPLKGGNDLVTVSYDEDVDHPILPPSPHTGGLQVWQHDLQATVTARRLNAFTMRTKAERLPHLQGDDPCRLWAEDLRNGIVVDILTFKPDEDPTAAAGTWVHLCHRNETFDLHGFRITSPDVDRGVRTAASRSIDPGVNSPLSHDVDETIFTWRLGSLVAKSRLVTEPGIASRTPVQEPPNEEQKIPWGNFKKPEFSVNGIVPAPYFFWKYRPSMRAAFVTGGVVPFEDTKARAAAMAPYVFQRYEFFSGPVSIPVTITDHYLEEQSPSLALVGSKVGDDLSIRPFCKISQRLLVPAQVPPQVARHYGIDEDSIATGAEILTLKNGALPTAIEAPTPNAESTGPAYCPDPACIGLWGFLTELDGTHIATQHLNFYDDNKDVSWPNYAPHMLELQWTDDTTPSLSVGAITGSLDVFPFLNPALSQAFICKAPPGQTYLLNLRPMVATDLGFPHAFAQGMSKAKNKDGVDTLTLSDLCRPTVIRLTHATDRPITQPTVVSVIENNVQTSATVEVPDVKQLSLGAIADASSTSTVTLLGSWQEATDDLNLPSSSIMGLSAQLAEFKFAKKSKNEQILPVSAQFPFSDSRYRRILVTPRGTARYGDYFGKQDKQSRTIDGPTLTIDVLAKVAPKAPDVEYVLPNQRMTISADGLKRTRTMGLTIVLNRPWFSSGIGEELAIITQQVASQNTHPVDSISTSFAPNAEDQVSAWGVLADFAPSFPVGSGSQSISLLPDPKILQLSPPTADVPNMRNIKIGDAWFSAACYTPRYNAQDQQWYVNLSLSTPPAYGTTVRLLVARYQDHAPDGLQVSETVLCDFVLVRPERSVLLTNVWQNFFRHRRIQIIGVGPTVQTSSPGEPIIPYTTFEVRHFETQQQEPKGFEWKALDIVKPDPGFPNGNILWQGALPIIHQKGTLVVQETEVWPSAEDPTVPAQIPAYFDIFLA